MTPRGLTPEDRFWMKVIARGPDECWPWIGAITGKVNKKYGKLFIGRDADGRSITVYAHRFSDELAHGPIPEGIEVDHACKDRSILLLPNDGLCMNPAHFQRVTGAKNKSLQGARQTHCLRNHEYTPENTYRDGRGQRRCRRCAGERRAA